MEIVDIIRGFGLTILKGVMEVRETKIWARFTVEAEVNIELNITSKKDHIILCSFLLFY